MDSLDQRICDATPYNDAFFFATCYGNKPVVEALLEDGSVVDIEIQNKLGYAFRLRAHYNFALLMSKSLKRGERYKEIRRSLVVVFSPHGIFGKKKPLKHIHPMVEETMERDVDVGGIFYVNGRYEGGGAIGRLVYDFGCTKAEEMEYTVLRETVEEIKQMWGDMGREKGWIAGRREGCQ